MKKSRIVTNVFTPLICLIFVYMRTVSAQSYCACQTHVGGSANCATCRNGCYLENSRCFECPNGCRTCTSSGYCDNCITGYYGTICEHPCSSCKENKCAKTYCIQGCSNGYYLALGICLSCPSACSTCSTNSYCITCSPGYYGTICQYKCTNCRYNTCNKQTGQCVHGCVDGSYSTQGGSVCAGCPSQCTKCTSDTYCTECASLNIYGATCQKNCDPNCKYGSCYKSTGVCIYGCVDGYYPSGASCLPNCQVNFCQSCTANNQVCVTCQEGYYILNGNCIQCSVECADGKCSTEDGTCTDGCKTGFTNRKCDGQCRINCITCLHYTWDYCTLCNPGYHGQSCENTCNAQCKEVNGVTNCALSDGSCTDGCEGGYSGATCTDTCSANCVSCDQTNKQLCDSCKPGFYGTSCENECSPHCGFVGNTRTCAKNTGICNADCTLGYTGDTCRDPCEVGCLNGCDRRTGTCDRCKPLFYGQSCQLTCNSTCYNPNNGSNVCDKQSGRCLFECPNPTCDLSGGVKGAQDSPGQPEESNGAVIGGAVAGAVVFVAVIIAAVVAFVILRRKRRKQANPDPGSNAGNIDAVYSVPNKTNAKENNNVSVESTALYAIPDKPKHVQKSDKTSDDQNRIYINLEETQKSPAKMKTDEKLKTPTKVNAGDNLDGMSHVQVKVEDNEDSLEEIDEVDIEKGKLTESEAPKADNYYNIYGLTRSRVQLDQLRKYVESKTPENFEKEFKKLPQGLTRPYDDAVSQANVTKNRYRGIYPYDATRVKLIGSGGDYINASYIEGSGAAEKTYIASLGPIDKFVKGYIDFWRMIWQEKVNKIVMLTNFVEGAKVKCDKYWPELGQTISYGDVSVECMSEDSFADFNITKLIVTKNSETLPIHHFHYTAWPDRGTPDNAVSLVEFRESVKRVDTITEAPIVVHCSAGIGRTGTYIALDILTIEGQTENYVDIFGCVLSLRGQRVGMVQNVDQYQYLHHAVVHSLTTKCDQIESTDFCTVSTESMDEGFHLLENLKDVRSEDEFKAIENNGKEKKKNRKGADIPGDAHRPRLFDKGTQAKYVNAVYVDSYKQPNKYLLAQTPLSTTVEEFLGLILQEKCSCIISLDTAQNVKKQDIGEYTPAINQELTLGKYKIKCTHSETTAEYELQHLDVTDSDVSMTVLHFQYTDWPTDAPVPSSTESFLNLIRDTKQSSMEEGHRNGAVLVHCLTGAKRSGLFPVVANLLEKMRSEQQASVVNATRQIRTRRPSAIPNKEQFHFIYECGTQFVENSSIYSNVL